MGAFILYSLLAIALLVISLSILLSEAVAKRLEPFVRKRGLSYQVVSAKIANVVYGVKAWLYHWFSLWRIDLWGFGAAL